MASGSFRFDRFALDPNDRQLRRDGVPVELNARYLDALILLVREQGKIISKERFLKEVWRGVPVTDEALTQCIKTLRKQLGDDAGNPRFIETAPKHGYRFIAPVEYVGAQAGSALAPTIAHSPRVWRQILLRGGAGAIGGGVAGLIGGLIYSFVGASAGMGAASALLVLVCLTMFVGLLGGAGVGLGIAAAGYAPGRLGQWSILGGALGGLIVGGFVKLVGLDTFDLLFGQTPGEITGAPEGAVLGGAVGFGVWLASRGAPSLRRSVIIAGACGAAGGVMITLLGGRLMAGSLHLLASRFPDSRLQIDQIGGMFGENGFGPISLMATAGFEGLLFGGCVVGATMLALGRFAQSEPAA
jgi:DNA-binding winged helix-turn-helix (wHTH) protein